ncbi:MAG: futalosine hydrolase [Candidatus Velthaea sp.]|jgi:futalosine hydrolase
MILVVCAVAEELDGFARPDVDVVCVGIGPVEAALGTLRALAAKPYALAINAGIAGGFAGRAPIGSAVAVTVERYLEIGREDGGAIVLPPGVRVEATCAADAGLLERYRSRLPKAVFGTGITSATITTSAARSAELATRYAPETESMEGFSVLRAAAVAGVAAVELRGISNIVGDPIGGWDFRAGSTAAVRALTDFLTAVEETT